MTSYRKDPRSLIRTRKIPATKLLVLKQAIADGGKVVLTGMDRHRGWSERHRNAARDLHEELLGVYIPEGLHEPAEFEILPAGREVVARLQPGPDHSSDRLRPGASNS